MALSQQEMGLKVNQEASFAVQLNGARGAIDAKVHTPSGAVEECYITELDNGEHILKHRKSQGNYLIYNELYDFMYYYYYFTKQFLLYYFIICILIFIWYSIFKYNI